ncbi:hypothetical protein HA050_06150 [Iodobacter sp. HSC-16F04]|uniref:Uncharacterized protein n=1 Tax=Iodobacter violaceini TaxID=3044271 RepID=A0ABX0KPJ3_9NEIS|nr:hypothetical protein [Iodobacter violacea]NHQ85701.1 hypothetical protein [Iodobacter violacea]
METSTLLGVIVGGLLTGIAPCLTIYYQHRRFVYDAKIARLNSKKEKYEISYTKIINQLSDAINNNEYPAEIISDISIIFPREVSDIFFDFMQDKEKDSLKRKIAYLNISQAMKEAIKDIEDRMDNTKI